MNFAPANPRPSLAPQDTLLLRCNSSVEIGAGHVTRCSALAATWRNLGGSCIFLSDSLLASSKAYLERQGFAVRTESLQPGSQQDAQQTIALGRELRASWTVVDGYSFQPDYIKALALSGAKILHLDDLASFDRYEADLVVNQGCFDSRTCYPRHAISGQLLAGPSFALMRPEFRRHRQPARNIPQNARHILIMMGGTDAANATSRVIQSLAPLLRNPDLAGLHLTAILGAGNPHKSEITAFAKTLANISVEIDPLDLPARMAAADLCISASGSTGWELCCLGVPTILIRVATNQNSIAQGLGSHGAAVDLGPLDALSGEAIATAASDLVLSPLRRASISHSAVSLVDGLGCDRVIDAMLNDLRLRPASEDDCRLLWEWANDPGVRAASFSSEPIPWQDHAEWFQRRQRDSNCELFIAQDFSGVPVGQLRVQWNTSGEGEIGVVVAPNLRGKGRGRAIIRSAAHQLLARRPRASLHAWIKAGNEPSLHAFEHAGFVKISRELKHGHDAFHFVCSSEAGA